jgi:hypothetical protein
VKKAKHGDGCSVAASPLLKVESSRRGAEFPKKGGRAVARGARKEVARNVIGICTR